MLCLDAFEPATNLPPLVGDEIHLWFCTLSSDTEEKAAVIRLRAQDLQRRLLQAYLGAPVTTGDFRISEFGRPSLWRWPQLGFNLSHSRQAAIVAITRDAQPGVDLEALARKRPVIALALRYFCPSESAVLACLSPAQAQRAFLALWTAKEAVLKAIGRGLAFGLHRLEFSLDVNGMPLELLAIASEVGTAAAWQCRVLRPDEEYLGCLAWRGDVRRVRTFRISASGFGLA